MDNDEISRLNDTLDRIEGHMDEYMRVFKGMSLLSVETALKTMEPNVPFSEDTRRISEIRTVLMQLETLLRP